MWFNDIAYWDAKKLRTNYIIWGCIYAALSVLAPIITVGVRYKLFDKASAYRLTGLGLIVAIIVGIVVIRFLVKFIKKLPETTHKEMCFKFSVEGIFVLCVLACIIALGYAVKSNFEYALVTLNICCVFWMAAVIVDFVVLKFLNKEYEYRTLAKQKKEVDKRLAVVK